MQCPLPANRARVMLVEDDAVTRRLLSRGIEKESSLQLVAAFGTVADSTAWLAANQCDLLLTDLGLPDGSGPSIIEACRKFHPEADIMVTTMFSDDEQVLACIEAGASGYVLKEAGHAGVVRALLEVLGGGSPISPVIARKVLTRMRTRMRMRQPAPESGAKGMPVPDRHGLTRREAAILELIARGSSYAKVANALGLSIGTVQTHIKHIYGKLSVHSRGEAVYEARKRGLLSAERFPAAADKSGKAD